MKVKKKKEWEGEKGWVTNKSHSTSEGREKKKIK